MKTIYKYDLLICDIQTLRLPAGAQILAVQEQHAHLYEVRATPASQRSLQLWALVDSEAPLELRTIVVVGTGNPAPAGKLDHLASVVTARGALVWHIFEVLEGQP